jgi:ankyrin repeat protein
MCDCVSVGHLECVELLLNKWANVNPIDRMGGTPLMDAVRYMLIYNLFEVIVI